MPRPDSLAILATLALLCGAPHGATVDAADSDLDAVLMLLAAHRHGRVEFIEQQFLAVLNHPLESSGELRYDAPDRLEKQTLAPRREVLVLSGDVLTVDRGKLHRVVDLSTVPQIAPYVESIRATLAGDGATLARLFTVRFSGSVAKWNLNLVPRDPKVQRTVAELRIDGTRDELLKVEIRQADGDRSLLTLRPSSTP